MSAKHTTESFIKKAIGIHGNLYDYSEFEYPANNKIKAKIICRKHGPWMQRPGDHISGYGCPSCGAKRKPTVSWDAFKSEAEQVHNSLYEYKKKQIEYMTDKVDIYCSDHGWFTQTVHHHINRKQGCRACCFSKRDMTNYISWDREDWVDKHKGKEVYLYIVWMSDENESFLKVGMTGRTIERRFSGANKKPDYDIMEMAYEVGDAGYIYDLESDIHKAMTPYKYSPTKRFVGHTECYDEEAIDAVLSMMRLSNSVVH